MKKIIAYLGCRKGSQRVKNKNSKIFCTKNQSSLFEIKIGQLFDSKMIDVIFFSTDDETLILHCQKYYQDKILSNKLIIHKREDYYASSKCSGKEYQEFVYNLFSGYDAHVLWTHTTSPFLNGEKYDIIIKTYLDNLGQFDSLMTVKIIQNFILNKNGDLINRNGIEGSWPSTQELETLYEVDSGVFLIDSKLMKKYNNRVGKKVYLYENNSLDSTDIDYPEDFEIAQMLWEKLS